MERSTRARAHAGIGHGGDDPTPPRVTTLPAFAMSRRWFGHVVPMIAVVGISGCVTGPNGQTTVSVTLAGAQAEAGAILNALKLFAANASGNVGLAISAAEAAINSFIAMPANASPASYVAAVLQTVSTVIGLIPIPPGPLMYIQLGLSLLTALVNGITSLVVPSTPATGTVAAIAGLAPAPIPIPLR